MERLTKWLRDILDRLMDKPVDPSKGWGPPQRVPLDWDFTRQTLRGVGFGAPPESFGELGQADAVVAINGDRHTPQLTFARSGLVLEFGREDSFIHDDIGLNYIGVLTGPDTYASHFTKHLTVEYSQLCIQPILPVQTKAPYWGAQTTREDLAKWFPEPPWRHDEDEKEDIFFYDLDDLQYEFEFNPANGPLKRINIYPDVS